MEKSSNVEVIARLDEIEMRLTAIERRLDIVPNFPVPDRVRPTLSQPVSASGPGEYQSSDKERREPHGGNILGAVGVLFFILAAAFFVRLAIESGWLTPIRQLGGATLFALILIALGFNLRSKDASYSGLLPGAGIVILFLTAYAGHLFYGLYDGIHATGAVALISAAALLLFRTFRHDLFLVSAIVGTYLVPLLLVPKGGELVGGSLYFLFWSILFCTCAILLGRRLLISATAYLTLTVFSMYANGSSVYAVDPTTQFWFQALQFIVLGVAVASFSVVRRVSLTSAEAWAFFPVLLLFYSIEYAHLEKIGALSAPWCALVFLVLLMAFYKAVRHALSRESLESAPMLATFGTCVLLHTVYLELLPRSYGAWFAVGLLIALSAFGKTTVPYTRFWPVHLMIWGIAGLEYLEALYNIHQSDMHVVALKNLVFTLILLKVYFTLASRKEFTWIMGLANLQALFGLSRLASVISAGDTSSYLTSGLWALFALGVLVAGNHLRDAGLARSSLAVFALVALKVVFYDIDQSSSIIRVFALVLIGGFMYAGGLFLRRVNQWSQK